MHRPKYFLLTPGPLTTAVSTKQAMLEDWGSWDDEFNEITAKICQDVLNLMEGEDDFVCVPMQGSGTFANEAALGSLFPPQSKTLVLINGAYGHRLKKILSYMGKNCVSLDKGEYLPPLPHEVEEILQADPEITHVAVIHCETSSGILNPVQEIGEVVKKYGKTYFIDAVSSFGALPMSQHDVPYDILVFSANKCFEGVPGFGFVLVRKTILEASKGISHSYSLDVYDQRQGFLQTRKWRFTPPTHVVVAFREAMRLHAEEGGVQARLQRYENNCEVLVRGLRELGLQTLLDDRWLSPIIVTFLSPQDANFKFQKFYDEMKKLNPKLESVDFK